MRFDFKKFIFKNIGFFMIFFISVLYIIRGLFRISETGASVAEIIGNGLLAMAVGFAINVIFRQNGILYGEETAEVIYANNLHAKTVDLITPKIHLLDEFCNKENTRVVKELRTKILSSEGLKYSNYFDNDGIAKGFEIKETKNKHDAKKQKRQYHAYQKALKLKITLLTPSSLTTDGAKQDDPFDFGMTKADYQKKKSSLDIVTRVLFGVLFGYFTLKRIENFSYEDLIWNALQIAIFLMFGVIQMIQSYMFIKNDDRARILKKVDLLQKFRIYSENI